MKRVKAGCILQTLIFMQKPEYGFSTEDQLKYNHEEFEKYKIELDRNKIRHQILSVDEQADGSIIIHVKKQLNGKVDVCKYFN